MTGVQTCALPIFARIARPLKIMARAARAVGRGERPPTLAEEGAEEVRLLARAMNQMSADLSRLAPNAKPKIDANLAALKQRLLKLSADSEAQLAQADNLSVVSLSDRLDYLIGGLNLERVEVNHKGDETWTPESLQGLTQTLKNNEVALVLDHRQPSAEVQKAIAEGGSTLVVIGADGTDPVAQLQGNIEAIIKALVQK